MEQREQDSRAGRYGQQKLSSMENLDDRKL
jgi:hypothetical protein